MWDPADWMFYLYTLSVPICKLNLYNYTPICFSFFSFSSALRVMWDPADWAFYFRPPALSVSICKLNIYNYTPIYFEFRFLASALRVMWDPADSISVLPPCLFLSVNGIFTTTHRYVSLPFPFPARCVLCGTLRTGASISVLSACPVLSVNWMMHNYTPIFLRSLFQRAACQRTRSSIYVLPPGLFLSVNGIFTTTHRYVSLPFPFPARCVLCGTRRTGASISVLPPCLFLSVNGIFTTTHWYVSLPFPLPARCVLCGTLRTLFPSSRPVCFYLWMEYLQLHTDMFLFRFFFQRAAFYVGPCGLGRPLAYFRPVLFYLWIEWCTITHRSFCVLCCSALRVGGLDRLFTSSRPVCFYLLIEYL